MSGLRQAIRRTTTIAGLSLGVLAGCDSGSSVSGESEDAGPRLAVSEAQLDAALNCFPATAPRVQDGAVLLIPGTGEGSELSWFDTYALALPALGYDVCTIDPAGKLLGDAQTSSEYVVAAIRRVAREFDGPVDVIGHSQGGLLARWAIRWWPDIAGSIDDYVSLATPQHGTVVADMLCMQNLIGCTEAVQQQRTTSVFLAALNAGDETPGAVSYTSLYSLNDEIVPQVGAPSVLAGASNILVQDACPARPVSHLGQLTDAAVFALVLDALSHAGPAALSRFDPATCQTLFAPGMEPAGVLLANTVNYFDAAGGVFTTGAAPEPALRDYTR